jgi:DnaK suppressor protein
MNIFDENILTPLRASLLVRENELVGEISAAREADIAAANAIGIAATDVNDLKDQASNRERTTLQDAEVQRDRNELADVRAALARLNDGTYGICIDCAQPIDLLRLTAIPAAARCMACQTQFESRAI